MHQQITSFLGPIFAKETLEIARRGRYYLVRTGYAVMLVFVMYLAWENAQVLSWRFGTTNLMARFAGMFFIAASYVQYWSVIVLVPAFLSGVIAGEREEHTLDLLFITPLSDREIVLGKLFSRAAAMVCLILCVVPVMSLMMLFGGIGPDSVWRVLAATLLAILFAGSHAIYFSVIARNPMEALSRCYISFFMWFAGLVIFVWAGRQILLAAEINLPDWMMDALGWLHLGYPLVSFWAAVDEAYHSTLVFLYGSWAWPLSFLLPALWSVILLWRAVRRLREPPRAPRWNVARLFRRKARNSATAAPTSVRRARPHRTWFGLEIANPLWLRGRLSRVYDRAGSATRMHWLGWVIAVIGITALAIYQPEELTREGYNFAFLGPSWMVVGLVTALVAGHSLIGDRRRGFLEQVAVTPMTGAEILDGTFLAIWEHMRRLLWLPVLLTVFFALTGASSLAGSFYSVITAVLVLVTVIWHGLACSLAARTTAGAVIATFILPVVVLFGLPLLVSIYPNHHRTALYTAIGIWCVLSWLWTKGQLNASSVGCFLTGMHLLVVGIAESWTYDRPDGQFPMAAMHPGFLVIAALFRDQMNRIGPTDIWRQQHVAIVACYWLALAVDLYCLRWWVIRKFDRLIDRADGRRQTRNSLETAERAG